MTAVVLHYDSFIVRAIYGHVRTTGGWWVGGPSASHPACRPRWQGGARKTLAGIVPSGGVRRLTHGVFCLSFCFSTVFPLKLVRSGRQGPAGARSHAIVKYRNLNALISFLSVVLLPFYFSWKLYYLFVVCRSSVPRTRQQSLYCPFWEHYPRKSDVPHIHSFSTWRHPFHFDCRSSTIDVHANDHHILIG